MTADSWELVDRAKTGDMTAWAALWIHYRLRIASQIRRECRRTRLAHRATSELVDDLTAETFTRAIAGIHGVTYRGNDIGNWLGTIAVRLVLDTAKCGNLFWETPIDHFLIIHTETLITRGDSTGDDGVTRAQATKVRQCVTELNSDRQRQAIELGFFDDLTVAETAAVLECNAGTVKALRQRALTILRDQLATEAEVAA